MKKMSQYCDSMIVYQDSIEILNRNKELMDMQEKYNQQKLLNEKNQLKIENNTIIRNVLITLVVVFCLIAILIYIYQRKLIRKEHIIQRNEEEIQLNTLKRQENERIISRNQSRMKELAEQMEANKDAQELRVLAQVTDAVGTDLFGERDRHHLFLGGDKAARIFDDGVDGVERVSIMLIHSSSTTLTSSSRCCSIVVPEACAISNR